MEKEVKAFECFLKLCKLVSEFVWKGFGTCPELVWDLIGAVWERVETLFGTDLKLD